MLVKRELLFTHLAVREKLVTREQLEECLEVQRRENFFRSLGKILVEKKYLSQKEVQHLIHLQEESIREASGDAHSVPGETLFGAIAVMKKFVSLSQVEECLKEQKLLRRLGIQVRLGEILVSKKFMTVEQVLDVLKQQHTHVLICGKCKKQFNVTAFSSRKKFFCNFCGDELIEPHVINSAKVEDKIEG